MVVEMMVVEVMVEVMVVEVVVEVMVVVCWWKVCYYFSTSANI